MKVRIGIGKSSWVGVAMLATALYSVDSGATAYKCKMHVGNGCNGPVVYEIQLCSKVSTNGGTCRRLCQGLRPVCNVTEFDPWVSAYDTGGFLSNSLGKHGFKGDLAKATNTENYDNTGQLAYTSGNTYTVCMSSAGALSGFSSEVPVAPAKTCLTVNAPSPTNCTAGTAFNGDPSDPRCVTKNSYCAGGGATGNFVTTMNAGFQMIAVQNEHFVVSPGKDSNLTNAAAIAGTADLGAKTPTVASVDAGAVTGSGPLGTVNYGSRSGTTAGGTGVAGLTGGTSSSGAATGGAGGVTDDSSFASKTFGMNDSEYKNGGGADAASGAGGSGGAGSGASWFGSGGGASAVAGGAAGEIAIEGGAGAAARGLASSDVLPIDDPADYFLKSDIDVSLFKRITAQCRKKEKALLLAP